jgi:hypothetical protein
MKAAVVLVVAATLLCFGFRSVPSAQQAGNDERGPRITVPAVKAARVVADGTFAPGEWDEAAQMRISENFQVHFMADSNFLYVGIRFLKDVQADFVSEVFLATSDRQFLCLHSSGALGEGVNAFSSDLRKATFSLGSITGWESNVTAIATRCQGKEYRISRTKLPAATLKVAGGLMVVNRTMRESGGFPAGMDFSGPSRWVELVLPPAR